MAQSDKQIDGFKFIKEVDIPEYNSREIMVVHEATGLEVIHLLNEDRENLFAFIFRTPVSDSTGLPHIMEHSALCGSERFRLKDPFAFLLKGSMNTYLNAFTAQDCTVYLAASTVVKDYFNLMLVYGDAVFHPLLTKQVFQQEGYHYEPDGKSGGLKIVGVVYNEMKGNYSNSEMIVGDWATRSLMPDTTYGYDSGGDPREIPDLTYEAFLAFHKKYYHPSNGKIFLYGNIPTETQLNYLQNNFLKDFSRRDVDSRIKVQPRWNAPKQFRKPYPIKQGIPLAGKSTVILNWLTTDISHPFELMQQELLSEILLGNAGSPLRKALVDSRLGEDLSPSSGIDAGMNQVIFCVGLRGTNEEKKELVEKLILDRLRKIRAEGLEPDIVEAAMHRIEFRKRELPTGNPIGIRLLFKALGGWIHDMEPHITILYDQWLEKLKTFVKTNPDFYKTLIQKNLLNNNHRSVVTIYPDPEKREKDDNKVREDLDRIAADKEQFAKISTEAEELKVLQARPDKPGDIAEIPVLSLKDLPRKVTDVPYEKIEIRKDLVAYYHDIDTNGIIYLDIAISLRGLEDELLDYIPLLGKMFLGCGLPGVSYDRVANLISLYTGGLSASLSVDTTLEDRETRLFIVSVKMLRSKFSEALDLVSSLLRSADFSDRVRVTDLVVELKNKYKSSIVPHGNYYTSLRAAAALSPVIALEERWHGIGQYLFLDNLVSHLDEGLEDVISAAEKNRLNLLAGNGVAVNISCNREIFGSIKKELAETLSALFKNGSTASTGDAGIPFPVENRIESVLTSSSINFVSHALKSSRLDSDAYSVELVLSHLLNTGFLWDRVRLKGGAYGVSGSSFGLEGIYTFSSFRDPRINHTLEAFEEALEYIKKGSFSQEELRLSIIGTVGKHEKPFRGARQGYVNFKRIIYGITVELRQRRRDIILGLTREDLMARGAVLLENFHKGVSVILSGKKMMDKEAKNNINLPGKILDLPL